MCFHNVPIRKNVAIKALVIKREMITFAQTHNQTNYGIHQRISQRMDTINSLLEQATCIARRSKEAAEETESTEGYKRRQTEELIKFANDYGLWIDLSHLNITYMDRGGENEVFHDGNVSVVKLNNFEYAGDDLEHFFIRIAAITSSNPIK